MKAGKPKKQAVAIALNTEREYSKGSRKAKLEDAYAKYIEEKGVSRRDDIRAAVEKHDKPIPKTTTGKGKNYLPTDQGAGMTAKGREAYNR